MRYSAMALLFGFSATGVDAIQAVHRALSAHAPWLLAHFDEVVRSVRFAPTLCSRRAAACVRPERYREIIFALAPEHMTMEELGRVLLHEARHWQPDGRGGWYVFPHTCSDPYCTRPTERAADPVYARDEELAPAIAQALTAAGFQPGLPFVLPATAPRPSPSFPWGDLLKGALVGAAAVGGALIIGSALVRTWDPATGRYRRSNGQFA